MTPWRRVATILGWSAAVCAVAFVPFVAFLYAFDGDSGDESTGVDVARTILLGILVVSPLVGGLVGLVRSLRGETTRDKVIWSLVSLVLLAVAWWALGGLAVLVLELLPGLD